MFAVEGHAAELLWREDLAEIPAELPVNQSHLANPDLALHLYGGAVSGLKKSNHPEIENDPYYLWSGQIGSNWVATFSDSRGFSDLSDGTVRWRVRQSGTHSLRIALRLSNGAWLVSEPVADATPDWIEQAFELRTLDWYQLEIQSAIELKTIVAEPDLTEVTEVGFTDLLPGGSSSESSRLDWIEVEGNLLPGTHIPALYAATRQSSGFESPALGRFWEMGNSWVYSVNLGYVAVHQASRGPTLYWYDYGMQSWIYSHLELFPYVYRYSDRNWLYFINNYDGNRWYYNFGPADFEKW